MACYVADLWPDARSLGLARTLLKIHGSCYTNYIHSKKTSASLRLCVEKSLWMNLKKYG